MPWQEIGACCGEHSPGEVCRSRLFESAVFESQSRLEMRMITTTDQWKFPMRFRPGTSTWRVAEFESPDRPWLLAEFEHVEAVYKSFLLTSIDTLVATLRDKKARSNPAVEHCFAAHCFTDPGVVLRTGCQDRARTQRSASQSSAGRQSRQLLGRVPNRHAPSTAGL